MRIELDRRMLLRVASFGLGSLALGAMPAIAQMLGARGFTHNVASGEPGAESMLLWTRFVPADGGAAHVRVEVSTNTDFKRIVAGGQMITGPWRDHTVKISVDGLAPATSYYYRFIGADGSISPVGRIKTLPVGAIDRVGIAVFSCANLGFGWFNAYRHAAQRDDVDVVLHMGDYIYEYQRGGYDRAGFARVAEIQPEHEILSLADYRLRYAAYRLDPDLQAIHQRHPFIVSTDDHEGANDTWEGGAQNHNPGEGDWALRRAAAMQAWHEWLPVGEQPWQSYQFGSLGTYWRTDSRMIARSRPAALGEIVGTGESARALAAFRDGVWQDPAATMLGSEQEIWLKRELLASVRAQTRWQLVGSGTIMGIQHMPVEAAQWLTPDAPARNRSYVDLGIAAARAGLPFNLDNWGGYPAARARLLAAAQAADANLIIVSGDSHNSWAYDLAHGGTPAGVEFAGHSVSSPGYESFMRRDPAEVARALVAASPELRWCDTSRRGYMHLTLAADAATNQWVFVDTVIERGTGARDRHVMRTRPDYRKVESL